MWCLSNRSTLKLDLLNCRWTWWDLTCPVWTFNIICNSYNSNSYNISYNSNNHNSYNSNCYNSNNYNGNSYNIFSYNINSYNINSNNFNIELPNKCPNVFNILLWKAVFWYYEQWTYKHRIDHRHDYYQKCPFFCRLLNGRSQ